MIFRSPRRVAGVTGLVAVVGLLAGCGGPSPVAPRTVPVERASVSTGVSATGSLSSSAQSNLGFARGGQLTSVDVRVGSVVRAGQVVASIDDFGARQGLRQAQTQLAGQQANLDRVRGSTGPAGAAASLEQANRIVGATRRSAQATLDADDRAIADAQRALDRAQKGAAAAQARFTQDLAACQAAQAQQAAAAAASSASASSGSSSMSGSSASGAGSIACTLVPGDQSAATMAQSGVGQAQTTLSQAKGKRTVDEAAGRLQVENARNGVVMARNGVDSTGADRSPNLDAAQAGVDGARVAVANAARDLANTVLRAPVDGRVTALNGAVGEYLAPSSGTTPFAPGADASIPGAATAAASGAGAAGAAGASVGRPGGGQFLVVQGASGFSVVAPFQEDDATTISPGQRVEISVDAVPDAVLAGTVTSVAPSATEISSVINYYVTIAVDRPDPRLRDGQTAQASVITGSAPDMLSVPNTAVTHQGQRTLVTVVGPDGRQVPTPFTAGLVGADRTEITSGLRAGQQVLATAAP